VIGYYASEKPEGTARCALQAPHAARPNGMIGAPVRGKAAGRLGLALRFDFRDRPAVFRGVGEGAANNSLSNACEHRSVRLGQGAMDNLSDWVATIAAVAVGLMPGLAILSARSIARLIYHTLGPRPEVMREPDGEPTRDEPAGALPSRV